MINTLFSHLNLQPSHTAPAADTTIAQNTPQAAPEAPATSTLTAEQLHDFRREHHRILRTACLAGEDVSPGPATVQILDEASANLREIAHQSTECLEAGLGAIETNNLHAACPHPRQT